MSQTFKSSLDTNLICRFLLNDVPAQREKVKSLLLDESQEFYVNDAVVAEVEHVLNKVYTWSHERIQENLSFFFSIENVRPESPYISEVLEFYKNHPSLSYVDCYSAFFAENNNKEPLYTFDKKLSNQHPSAKLLK